MTNSEYVLCIQTYFYGIFVAVQTFLRIINIIQRAQGSSAFKDYEANESPPCTSLRHALDGMLGTTSRLLCELQTQLAPRAKNYPILVGLFSDQERLDFQTYENPKHHLKHLKVGFKKCVHVCKYVMLCTYTYISVFTYWM